MTSTEQATAPTKPSTLLPILLDAYAGYAYTRDPVPPPRTQRRISARPR